MKDGSLYLAKMSAPLRFIWSWRDTDPAAINPTSVTIARDPAGRWFVTFQVDAPDFAPHPSVDQSVGVDLGLTHFAVLSTGEKVPHPRNWERHERQLKRWQRRLAKCQRGSANRVKRAVKVARAHAGVADARRDFLHKFSTRLVRENDVIAVEDLNVRGMVRNRRLARTISCSGWADFRSMLEYKAQRYGRTVVTVDRWYPSSKTCSACGHVVAELSLSTRTWQCLSCGTRHDRDLNAAKNILAAGLAAGTGKGANACGGDVRRTRATWPRPPVKQEAQPVREGFPP